MVKNETKPGEAFKIPRIGWDRYMWSITKQKIDFFNFGKKHCQIF